MSPPKVEAALVADIPVIFARPETTKSGFHPGLDHLGAGRDRSVEDACLDRLLR
jgi:hypothetical protein